MLGSVQQWRAGFFRGRVIEDLLKAGTLAVTALSASSNNQATKQPSNQPTNQPTNNVWHSSATGFWAMPFTAHYGASKAALQSFSDSLRCARQRGLAGAAHPPRRRRVQPCVRAPCCAHHPPQGCLVKARGPTRPHISHNTPGRSWPRSTFAWFTPPPALSRRCALQYAGAQLRQRLPSGSAVQRRDNAAPFSPGAAALRRSPPSTAPAPQSIARNHCPLPPPLPAACLRRRSPLARQEIFEKGAAAGRVLVDRSGPYAPAAAEIEGDVFQNPLLGGLWASELGWVGRCAGGWAGGQARAGDGPRAALRNRGLHLPPL